MEYEIELKLLTDEHAGVVIETKLLPQLNAKVTQETLLLTNHYFDTPDRRLRQHDIGLRIRGNNQKFEQTLKTAGKSMGGLHQRPEYNVGLDESKNHDIPDLKLFPTSAWPKTLEVDDLQVNIETLFSTHFARKVYLLEFPHGDIVELVWDLGKVTSGDKSAPICEIELELIKGNTTVLFDLAKCIVSLMPTCVGTESKAARGYNLLDELAVQEHQRYKQNPSENMPIDAEMFASLLTTLLQDFQLFSTEIRRQYSEVLETNIKQVLFALVENLAQFCQHFPCRPIELIFLQLKTLADNWSIVTQQDNKDGAVRLLVQAQTTQLQLDIVQCLIERPWSSTVSS